MTNRTLGFRARVVAAGGMAKAVVFRRSRLRMLMASHHANARSGCSPLGSGLSHHVESKYSSEFVWRSQPECAAPDRSGAAGTANGPAECGPRPAGIHSAATVPD